jgi:hypothetical protein
MPVPRRESGRVSERAIQYSKRDAEGGGAQVDRDLLDQPVAGVADQLARDQCRRGRADEYQRHSDLQRETAEEHAEIDAVPVEQMQAERFEVGADQEIDHHEAERALQHDRDQRVGPGRARRLGQEAGRQDRIERQRREKAIHEQQQIEQRGSARRAERQLR